VTPYAKFPTLYTPQKYSGGKAAGVLYAGTGASKTRASACGLLQMILFMPVSTCFEVLIKTL
jgi:hypothetical protein